MADVLLFVATAVGSVLLQRQQRQRQQQEDPLRQALRDKTSLNATERICIVTPDNEPLPDGALRADMRLLNLWHRATYVLIKHEPSHLHEAYDASNTYVLVQRRSPLKDYCPNLLDPNPGGVVELGESYRDNAIRELQEEMGIDACQLQHLFTFPYEDDHVRVWGAFFEATYHGALHELTLQETEVAQVLRLSLPDLEKHIQECPDEFMPDARHAMRLYFQHQGDGTVRRKLLPGYSSNDLDRYILRPRPKVVFFDCDDCLYFDGWKVANRLTAKIDEWCVNHGLASGQAYQLYKEYGTALRGLLAEGYLDDDPDAIEDFLRDVHNVDVHTMLSKDHELRRMLQRMDPSIPKYIFTASVSHHARRCLEALGIDDLFDDVIDCQACNLETKHSKHSFQVAMRIAGVDNPEECLFLDDSLTNIAAAREIGWRSILVGRVGRDCGQEISSEHAELEINVIHDVPKVLPELFVD